MQGSTQHFAALTAALTFFAGLSQDVNGQVNLDLLRTNTIACNLMDGSAGVSLSTGGGSGQSMPLGTSADQINETVQASASGAHGMGTSIALTDALSPTSYNQTNLAPFVSSFAAGIGNASAGPSGWTTSSASAEIYCHNDLTVQPIPGVTKGLLKGRLSVFTSEGGYDAESMGYAAVGPVAVDYNSGILSVYVNDELVFFSLAAKSAQVRFEQVVSSNANFGITADSYFRGRAEAADSSTAFIGQTTTSATVEVEAIEEGNPSIGVKCITVDDGDPEEPIVLWSRGCDS